MDDAHLLRYSRQIHIPGIDISGQEKLLDSRVLLIGLGGLGSPIAMYLASSGVGHLVISDFDHVELSNLQRQIIHGTGDIGVPKVESARSSIASLNPDVTVEMIDQRLEGDELLVEIEAADVVVDATDNFGSRFELNRLCHQARTPLVSGAAIRMEGQVSVYRLDLPDAPCYRCLYPDTGELGERCAETGVLGPVVGIIGTIEATETIKVLLDLGETLTGRLLILDARTMEWCVMKLTKDPNCPVCSKPRGEMGTIS